MLSRGQTQTQEAASAVASDVNAAASEAKDAADKAVSDVKMQLPMPKMLLKKLKKDLSGVSQTQISLPLSLLVQLAHYT